MTGLGDIMAKFKNSNGEVSMRMKAFKTPKSSGWLAKVSRVLIYTMLFSAFMHQGWYQPQEAQAAIGYGAWSESHTGTTGSTSAASFTWSHAGGATPGGVLVFVFTNNAADYITSVTYGGTPMTRVAGGLAIDTAGEPGRTDTFFLGAAVPTGTQSIVVTRTNNTSIMYGTAATVTSGGYDTEPTGMVLLQDDGTYTVQSVNDGSPGSNSMRFAGGYSGATAALPAGTGSTALGSIAFGSYNFSMVRETTAGQGARNVGFNYTTSDDRAGVHLAVREIIPRLTIGEGTDPANANAPRSALNNALDSFTMAMNVGTATVNSLTVTGVGSFTSTNIPTNGVKVWRDAGTIGVWDGADTLISTASSAIAGNVTTVTISPAESITTTVQNYLVTVDMLSGATLAQTFTGSVTAASGTGLGTPLYNDATSATLTVSAAQNLTVSNGSNLGTANVLTGSRDNALDAFTLALSAGSGNVATLTLTGSANFTAANISGIKIYRDNATVGTFNGADVLVPSTHSFAGYVATINLTSAVTVTTAAANYLVLVDFSTTGIDGSYTGTITGVAGSGLSGFTYSDSSSATLITKHPATISACSGCHGYTSIFTDATTSISRGTPDGAFVGDHDAHVVGIGTVCATCHTVPGGTDNAHRDGNIQMQGAIAGGFYSKVSPIAQVNNLGAPTTGTCSNISCHGGNNPTPQWGVGTAGCVDCHKTVTITRTKAAGTLDPVVGEFAQQWGHKNQNRGAVTNADCIVCHLEGKYTTQKTSSYHADGNIDLRDPDGAGETPIQKVSSATTFTFTKFATSYASGARTTTGHLSDNIDNVLTQKFCIACHDSDGATNPTARTPGGTAEMPFGGIALGAGYVAANNAIGTQGLIDVKTQFATTNTSVHPVLGPRTSDYPIASRLAVPYNSIGTTPGTRTAGAHNLADSVVMNCFDCHNTVTRPTNRTIVAHGNAVTIMAPIYTNANTTSTTMLCTICHTGYNATPGTSDNHGSGSALQTAGTRGNATTTCHNCHASTTTSPARPIRAQDYHGFSSLVGGNYWAGSVAAGKKAYSFVRNTSNFIAHRPYRTTAPNTEWTTGSATCQGDGSRCAGNNGTQTYTPGGTY